MKHTLWVVATFVLAALLLPAQSVAAQSLNSFTITNFDIQYELSRDSEGHSVLKTTETITADFPESDQNHGLERAIPRVYDGHSTALQLKSVTDGSGVSMPYSTYEDGELTILRIGSSGLYVHGLNTYKIVYTQKDVTRYFADTQKDEWYWDTNGTAWKVPIASLTVSVRLDDDLTALATGMPACYQGVEGSSSACDNEVSLKDGIYSISAENLYSGENVSLAFGFPKGTFTAYTMTFADIIKWVGILAWPLSIVAIAVFAPLYEHRKNRRSEEKPIPVQYIPPKDASVMVASQVITGLSGKAFSAQLIDLAVRHYIDIIETKAKTTFAQADYDVVIKKDISALRDEEKELLIDMFGATPAVGQRLKLSSLRNNMGYSVRTRDNDQKLRKLVAGSYALRTKEKNGKATIFYIAAAVLLALAAVSLSVAYLIAAITIFIYGVTLKPLTDYGLALRRYLLGLKEYVKLAETERLKFLQGPDTAEKVGYNLDPNNPGQLVKLYERTLPYAILFGYEKKWAESLSDLYAKTSTVPTWYVGASAFNAANFTSSLNSFSTAAASYGGSSSSSSSGGSGGGGFSGGGGGGGGGGGW